jgi:prepilin-type N-terminal cleavage/methylation domain-containing protein
MILKTNHRELWFPRGQRRRGFSLLELLIVITILALLATLGFSASMKLMLAQQRKNTQDTVLKVGEGIRQQWEAAFAAANDVADTQIPSGIVSMGGGDMRKARVLYRKYYLRREFPTSLSEATSPKFLAPKPGYAGAASSLQGVLTPDEEAGVCLYLILMQTRRGNRFDVDTALSSRDLSDKTQSGVSLSTYNVKMVVDDWGYPLRLYRWPWQSVDLNPNGAQALADREDPEGALSGTGGSFSSDCHPVPGGGKAYKMMPVIVSAGENSQQDGYPGLLAVLSAGLKVQNANLAGSCIYSSNLRMGGHGAN